MPPGLPASWRWKDSCSPDAPTTSAGEAIGPAAFSVSAVAGATDPSSARPQVELGGSDHTSLSTTTPGTCSRAPATGR